MDERQQAEFDLWYEDKSIEAFSALDNKIDSINAGLSKIGAAHGSHHHRKNTLACSDAIIKFGDEVLEKARQLGNSKELFDLAHAFANQFKLNAANRLDTYVWQSEQNINRVKGRAEYHAIHQLFNENLEALSRKIKLAQFDFERPKTTHQIVNPLQSQQLAAVISKPKKGGRPPAEWWDDLWIEIFRQIYVGDLIPKTQADITRAMADYLATKGIDGNESTLKPRARKLFAMLEQADFE